MTTSLAEDGPQFEESNLPSQVEGNAGSSARLLAAELAKRSDFANVVAALRSGASATIDGAWGSSKGLAIGALRSTASGLIVVVLPHESDVDGILDDLRLFAGSAPAVLPALADSGSRERSTRIDEAQGRRLSVLKAVSGPDPPAFLVATIHALQQPLPTLERVARGSRGLSVGDKIPVDVLLGWLVHRGWQRRDAVAIPGEFSLRGGIVDIFPFDAPDPFRVEFFGDEIESLREFSVESQRSLRQLNRVVLTALEEMSADAVDADKSTSETAGLGQLVPRGTWFVLVEPFEMRQEADAYLNRLEDKSGLFTGDQVWAQLLKHPTVTLSSLPGGTMETSCSLLVESVERFSGEGTKVKEELDRVAGVDRLLIFCHNDGERKRLGELFRETKTSQEGRLEFSLGRLANGFRWVAAGVALLSDHEIFQRTDTRRAGQRRRYTGRAIDSFLDLNPGDYVVHLAHGIGIFRSMKMLEKNDQLEEHLAIEFADETLAYVPASKIELIQKYVGSSHAPPRLAKIGGTAWEKRKEAVAKAVNDLASDLIDVQAKRQTRAGHAFPTDSEWMRQFESEFPFTETRDQLLAIEEIRTDMQSPRPMDRLLCGDVGYGKTELAMRAAFKAIDSGKQVAVLVPTTVLAQQHLRTFRQRMAEFPFAIEAISRFETKGEQKKILQRAADGSLDVLIGTHRLISKDVHFKDLGLLIVDEEQRFGVEHKEKLKLLRAEVDILTMTATPIPRTLHQSLLGIRDISNLETPPQDRQAVETRISRFDAALIRHAVLRELNRDGQVYFVHNRVQDIKRVAAKLKEIVPELRVAIIHGQMPEHEIEEGMVAFLERRADLLLATTIIESGLDIPNANTMFIDEGDRYGLADMHQLRGRVGRSGRRAYCYVLVDPHKILKPDAQRRLKAIEEYSQLGAGFKIALRDLEIRGAGNILGTEQSGHIAAVGYELYCHLLENAVRAQKKQPLRSYLDVTIELPWKAYFPGDYLPGERHRIDAYRRLSVIRDLNDLADFRSELVDRFGPVPEVGQHLIELAELRILAQLWQIEAIRPDPNDGQLFLTYRSRRRIETLEKLRKSRVVVVDAKQAVVRVPPDEPRSARRYADLLKRLLQPS